MEIDAIAYLTSETGQTALRAARACRDLAAHRRPAALRAFGDSDAVRATLQQDDLRCRARTKTPHAERMLFEGEALEQATAWPVAVERATRWPGPPDSPLVDLGAGLGFDTLAAALGGRQTVAIERDPVRAALLRFNALALGVADRVTVIEGDATEIAREGGRLAFLDPARRPGGRRTRRVEQFEPPHATWNAWLEAYDAAQVKLPPGQARDPIFDGETLEVVSLAGRARECRLFRGAWGTLARRRALRLPDGTSIDGDGRSWPDAISVESGLWLLDPDPSVTLADLVGDLCARDALAPVHPRIAYLIADRPVQAAPGRWLEVDAVLRARPREINAWLRDRKVGPLTVKTRGVADDAERWRRRLHAHGALPATVVLTRDRRDRWVALGCLDGPLSEA